MSDTNTIGSYIEQLQKVQAILKDSIDSMTTSGHCDNEENFLLLQCSDRLLANLVDLDLLEIIMDSKEKLHIPLK